MLDQTKSNDLSSENTVHLKQVEFNTVSVAGGCHAAHVSEMHAYMARTTACQQHEPSLDPSSLPPNPTISSIVSALASAHSAYGPPKSSQAKETAILMIVQPFNYNIADERPLEYGLWALDPPVPTFHCCFPLEALTHTSLTDDRELLYHPPFRGRNLPPIEISVVYMRAGYDAREYDARGTAARLHLERSRAIKCPDILGQLAGCKMVQQALSRSGASERFLKDEIKRTAIEESFGRMWPLDATELGRHGREIALDSEQAVNYVLKPSREGGGHNVYRADIPKFLEARPASSWGTFILMELFDPPKQEGKLMTADGIYVGEVVSELGIFGTCLWRRDGTVVENSSNAGWSFKTKPANVDEMSVVKGYGCFDCPRLIDIHDIPVPHE